MDVGRNDLCKCGSGKKYKKCCLNKTGYTFFYDESFYDKYLTVKNRVNFLSDRASDVFSFVFIGMPNNDLAANLNSIDNIEKNYKNILRIKGELKSTRFRKANFKDGLASMDANCLGFYHDVFKTVVDKHFYLKSGAVSKTSLLVFRFLENAHFPDNANEENSKLLINQLVYVLSKFLYTYKTLDFFDNLINKTINGAKDALIISINSILQKNENLLRKKVENEHLKVLVNFLQSTVFDEYPIKKEFEYRLIHDALFHKATNWSFNANDIDLIIDNEYYTYTAGLGYGYKSINNIDSAQEIGVRLSDFVVSFFGRSMKAIEDAMREVVTGTNDEIKDADFSESKYLPERWFEISESQFLLASTLCSLINSNYFSSFLLSFCDVYLVFIQYLGYIGQYKNFEEYKSTSVGEHALNHNAHTIDRMCKFTNGFNQA